MEKKWDRVAVVCVGFSIILKHMVVNDDVTPVFFTIASDLSAILGVIYVICIARQERLAYLFGIGNVILYALAVYNKGLYLSAAYNLVYSFPVLIYGYIYWGRPENTGTSGVKKFSNKNRVIGIILMFFAVIGLALVSENFLGGNDVWLDSIVSVCVCVATFLLARKYIEQWFLFIISNFMGIVLFFPSSLSDFGSIDLFTMWVVYFINSIYGYVSWRKSLLKEND